MQHMQNMQQKGAQISQQLEKEIEELNNLRQYWHYRSIFTVNFISKLISEIIEKQFLSLTQIESMYGLPIGSLKSYLEDLYKLGKEKKDGIPKINYIDNFAYYGITQEQAIAKYNEVLYQTLDILFFAAGVKDKTLRESLVKKSAERGEIPKESLYLLEQNPKALNSSYLIYFDLEYNEDGTIKKITFLKEQEQKTPQTQRAIPGPIYSSNAFNNALSDEKVPKELSDFLSGLSSKTKTIIVDYDCDERTIKEVLDLMARELVKMGYTISIEKNRNSYLIDLNPNTKKDQTAQEVRIYIKKDGNHLLIIQERKIPQDVSPIRVVEKNKQEKIKQPPRTLLPKEQSMEPLEKQTSEKEKPSSQPAQKKQEQSTDFPNAPKIEKKPPAKQQSPKTQTFEEEQKPLSHSSKPPSNSSQKTNYIKIENVNVPIVNIENLTKDEFPKLIENLEKGERLAISYKDLIEREDLADVINSNKNINIYFLTQENNFFVVIEKK